jgi:hypothetical protein
MIGGVRRASGGRTLGRRLLVGASLAACNAITGLDGDFTYGRIENGDAGDGASELEGGEGGPACSTRAPEPCDGAPCGLELLAQPLACALVADERSVYYTLYGSDTVGAFTGVYRCDPPCEDGGCSAAFSCNGGHGVKLAGLGGGLGCESTIALFRPPDGGRTIMFSNNDAVFTCDPDGCQFAPTFHFVMPGPVLGLASRGSVVYATSGYAGNGTYVVDRCDGDCPPDAGISEQWRGGGPIGTLATDETRAYFTAAPNQTGASIVSCDGTDCRALVTTGKPGLFALAGAWLYYAGLNRIGDDTAIWRCPLPDCPEDRREIYLDLRTRFAPPREVRTLAADECGVYWVTEDETRTGLLETCPAAACTNPTAVAGDLHVYAMTLTKTHLYVSNNGSPTLTSGVYRVAR